MRQCLRLAIFLAIRLAAFSQDNEREEQLKAVFLFNFAQYVRWPDEALRQASELVVCVDSDAHVRILEDVVRDKDIGGRTIRVRKYAPEDDLRPCNLLYVPERTPSQATILKRIGSSPVLTVGESSDFLTNGGMIRLERAANRIRFQINPSAAERAGLSLSSRLLRLADIVRVDQ
jgi:hypothetical protein